MILDLVRYKPITRCEQIRPPRRSQRHAGPAPQAGNMKKKRTFKNYKSKVIKSPYSYKNSKGHSQPPSKALDGWAVKKGIAPRDAKGRFMKRKTLTFLIARSIGRNGIQGISFFQKPLMLGLREFGKELLGNVKEDIINSLTTVK